MNIFDAHISGSLSVSASAEISNNLLVSGNLTVLGTVSGSISGSITNADSASFAPKYTLTSSFNTLSSSFNTSTSNFETLTSSFQTFTSSYTTGSFTGSFKGDGLNLYNIPASGITGLNLSQIAEGSATASISSTDGLRVNQKVEITGSLIATGQISGSFVGNGSGLYNIPASGVTGLNLTQIADGSATASISGANGLRVNSNTEITGALKINNINLGSDNTISIQLTAAGGKYFVDNVRNPKLNFVKGFTYRFYFDDNNTHPFEFSTTDDGTHNGGTTYTSGVTTNPSPFYIQIVVTDSTPSTLYYFCDHHIGMGNSISISNDILNNQVDSSFIFIEPSRIATTGSNQFYGNQNISGSVGVTGSLQITGSISLNGQPIGTGKLDETTFQSYTSSNNSRIENIETSTGSLNTFTSSIDTTIKSKLDNDGVISGSIQVNITGITGYSTFSSSNVTFVSSLSSSVAITTTDLSSSIGNLSSSVATTTVNLKNRVDSVESSTGSLNSFTSSINTTIKDKMNADGVLSGSITFDISTVPGFTGLTQSVSGSISSSVSQLSGSLTLTVSNLSSSLTNTDESQNNRIVSLESSRTSFNSFTSSIDTTIKSKLNTEGVISGSVQVNITGTTGYSTFSSSIATTDSNQNSRLDTIESRYVTTGSNSFNGNQTITGSLVVTDNLTVLGSSSIVYSTASQLIVEDNVIVVNSSYPAERFAGLEVHDSGSNGSVTASLFWDGLNNRWIYQNTSDSHYGGAMFIAGPRNTGSLGDEPSLTSGKLPKSIGGDHIGDSIMNELSGSIYITGSLSATGTVYGTNITSIESSTGSLNTFTSSVLSAIELTGSNLTVKGNLLVKGTTTNVNTTTLDVDNNLINLNGTGATSAGLRVKDTTGPNQVSGSLLWDATNDYWVAGQLGSEQRLVRETEFNTQVTRIDNVESSTGSLNSFTSSINTTIKSKLNNDGVISGSAQVNHNATTNYDSNQHIDHTTVSVSAGNGLSGGGTIASTRTLTLDTGSVHFLDGVKKELNTEGVFSGSAQVTGLSNSQLTNSSITIGSTSTSLGGTSTSLAGLTSVTSTAFTGSLQGYATSETLATVTARGASTTNKVTITASGTGGSPLFSLAASNSATFVHGQETFAANLTSGQAIINPIGVAGSTKNAGYIGYKYSGTGGSNDNLLTFGHWGADHLMTMNGQGNVAITGTISASNLSGTNTGDQTNITGNAGTVTNGVYTTGDQTIGGVKTFSNKVVFTSTVDNRPQFPGGMLGLDTGDGDFDIWGISRDYYPSHATSSNAWGLRWYGTDNQFRFVGGGTNRVIMDMDTGDIVSTGIISGSTIYGTWNGTAIANSYLANSSFYVGTTSISLGRGSASQTLTGVSIDGNAATVTGGVYTSGDQTIGGTKTFSSKIVVGTFANSTTNTGEAWFGRASDRNAGTFTVQLGGNSASSRQFEVVDYAWSVVLFSVTSSGTATLNGSAVKSVANSSYSTTFSSVTSVTVTHNLGTKDVAVFVYDSSDNMFWPSSIVTTSTSVVTVTFASSRSGRVVVVR